MFLAASRWTIAIVAVGLVLIIAGQAFAGVLLPDQHGGVAEATGRAGFAYLTGIRTFAAAIIWNRLEPIFHEYYGDVPLSEQVNVLPMIKMVNWLNPQFEDGYYVAAWVLSQRGDVEEAFDVAEAGVEANPESGLLRTSYAQILFLNDERTRATTQAELAFEATDWQSDIDKHDNFGVLAAIFRASGDTVMQQRVEDEIERLDVLIGDQIPEGSHDHDGDGEPDH